MSASLYQLVNNVHLAQYKNTYVATQHVRTNLQNVLLFTAQVNVENSGIGGEGEKTKKMTLAYLPLN